MDTEEKLDTLLSEPTEEVITKDDLRVLLDSNDHPVHYIGLEISGMLHIGSYLLTSKKINDFYKIGAKTNILLADWHTVANNKMGGDWNRIIKAADWYKKLFALVCPHTNIILGSELYKDNDEYWKTVIKMSSQITMARATRTLIIEGRNEKDTLHVSQYIYPVMQAADIYALDADIPHAGLDQRKVHMLAKELFESMEYKKIVPLHQHLLPSLLPPLTNLDGTKEEITAALKMSKSKPGSAIRINMTPEEISNTIKSAWCPEKVSENNPVLDICKYIIFPINGFILLERSSKYGGDITYYTYQDLESDYKAGKLHPIDLKQGVADALAKLLEPARNLLKGRENEIKEIFG
ncbi:MAG: tyrosine--tRNA ligase [Candidatus Micrarchaeia archaeon]